MSAGSVLAVAVPVLAIFAILAIVTTARQRDSRTVGEITRHTRRADRSTIEVDRADPEAEARRRYARVDPRSSAVEVPRRPPRDPEQVGITRRQLFNRGVLVTGAVSSGGFGAAVLAFLWPSGAAGFGSKVTAGRLGDILDTVEANREPAYVPEARSYLARYPETSLEAARSVYDDRLVPGMEAGVVALFQRCPHLGCRVPWCSSSQWFECPCHGSQYNRVGEKRGGPAPRGMDRFPVEFDGERVIIDTGSLIVGPAVGTNTTGQEAEGPHCVEP